MTRNGGTQQTEQVMHLRIALIALMRGGLMSLMLATMTAAQTAVPLDNREISC
ncbi:MAG: hypothetical protein ABW220_15865 [Burkholderiaceae bacterium]